MAWICLKLDSNRLETSFKTSKNLLGVLVVGQVYNWWWTWNWIWASWEIKKCRIEEVGSKSNQIQFKVGSKLTPPYLWVTTELVNVRSGVSIKDLLVAGDEQWWLWVWSLPGRITRSCRVKRVGGLQSGGGWWLHKSFGVSQGFRMIGEWLGSPGDFQGGLRKVGDFFFGGGGA